MKLQLPPGTELIRFADPTDVAEDPTRVLLYADELGAQYWVRIAVSVPRSPEVDHWLADCAAKIGASLASDAPSDDQTSDKPPSV